MGKLRASWRLFVQSLRMIRDHPRLLLFHVVLAALMVLLVAFWVLPFGFVGTGYGPAEPAHWAAVAEHWFLTEATDDGRSLRPLAYALPVAFYLTATMTATFVNVALMHEVLGALNGRAVSISGGLVFATTRIRAVLAWSLLAGAVGVLIRVLEQRFGVIGQWVLRLVGIGWSVAAVFVVPVIVREGVSANPVRHLRTSAGILRRTWGETLLGFVGINIGFAVALAALVLLTLASGVAMLWHVGLLVLILPLLMLGILATALLSSLANQVYRGALYVYATEGVLPGPYDAADLDRAWKLRSGRR
jgi:hypothetical protein